jgi:P27 family predicted phage terminase small subunit
MGARGPAKAPPNLRLLTGRAAGRDSGGRVVEPPPPFDDTAPEPPPWLGEYAAEVWAISVGQIVKLNLTKPEDFAALAAYCESVEQFRDATLDIRRRGLIHETVKDGVRFVAYDDLEWDPEEVATEFEGRKVGYFRPAPVIERKANPSVAVQNAAAMRIKALGTLFGFNPSAMGGLANLGKGGGVDGDVNPFSATG